MVNSISGTPNKSPSQSPGQQRRYNNENRGRNRTPQGKSQGRRDSSQGKRSGESITTRLCYNCDKITTHFANTCPEPRIQEGKFLGITITPYPRSRDSSRDIGANQGGNTYIILKVSWGEEMLETGEKDKEKEKITEDTEKDRVEELAKFEQEWRMEIA